MSKKNYVEISIDEFRKKLDSWIENKFSVEMEQYLTVEKGEKEIWIACDNRTRDFWVEEFDSRRKAVRRLNKF